MSILNEIAEWVGTELYCRDVYARLASTTDNPYARRIFLWLSEACGNHAQYLRKTLEVMGWNLPDELFKPKRPLRLQRRRFTCDVEEVYWTAKEHLSIEEEMQAVYRRLSRQISNPRAQDILDQIANEEAEHYRELSQLIQAFEQIYGGMLGEAAVEEAAEA